MMLTTADFPLYCVGPLVYRRMESSPFLTCLDDQIASDVCARLNRDEMSKWETGVKFVGCEIVAGSFAQQPPGNKI